MFIFLICHLFIGYFVTEVVSENDTFSCLGRPTGYYADVASNCEKYHICGGGKVQFTHSCPNATRFQQRMMICAHWYLVDCRLSERDFGANLLIGQRGVPFVTSEEFLSKGNKDETRFNQFATTPFSRQNLFPSTTPQPAQKPNPQKIPSNLDRTANKAAKAFSFPTPTARTTFFTTRPPANKATTPFVHNFSYRPTTFSSTTSSPRFSKIFAINGSQFTFSPTTTTPPPPVKPKNFFPYPTPTKTPVNQFSSNFLEENTITTISPSILRSPKAENAPIENDAVDYRRLVQPSVRLEWTLPDTRAMLYIPDDPADAVAPNIKRFSVTIPKPNMNFKGGSPRQPNGPCPENCHPDLLSSITCQPCISIK